MLLDGRKVCLSNAAARASTGSDSTSPAAIHIERRAFDIGAQVRGEESRDSVVDEAKRRAFTDKPLALGYLNYYLGGLGGTLNEDNHLNIWIRGDAKARRNIADEIRVRLKKGKTEVVFDFEFDQDMFGDQDFRFMYGTIDYMHVLADFTAGTVKLWFLDCYEWHPTHKEYQPPCPDSKLRNTNFLHAALVQMKLEGAKDFWMKGEATFPMSLFPI